MFDDREIEHELWLATAANYDPNDEYVGYLRDIREWQRVGDGSWRKRILVTE